MTSYSAMADGALPAREATGEERPLATDYSAQDDRALAAQAAQGREGAFRELLSRYERPVFSLVYRMVRDRTLAEDLAQEAFIRAFHAIGSYDSTYKFSSWIFKIANNHTIDHLRKRKLDTVSIHGAPSASTEDEVSRTSITLESMDESPDDYVESRELLRHVEGYAYDEIAETLELPLGTVKTYLHRARNELKEILSPRIDDR